jgi:hypothetical protein
MEEATMIVVRKRFTTNPKQIAWSSVSRLRLGRNLHAHGTHRRSDLDCAACRGDSQVTPVDDLAKTGFCAECIDDSRSNLELGGEA